MCIGSFLVSYFVVISLYLYLSVYFYISILLCVCLSVFFSLPLSLSLPLSFSLSLLLSISIPLSLFVPLSLYIYIYVAIFQSISLPSMCHFISSHLCVTSSHLICVCIYFNLISSTYKLKIITISPSFCLPLNLTHSSLLLLSLFSRNV